MNLRALHDGLASLADVLGEAEPNPRPDGAQTQTSIGHRPMQDSPAQGQRATNREPEQPQVGKKPGDKQLRPLAAQDIVRIAAKAGGVPFFNPAKDHALIAFHSKETAEKFVGFVGTARKGLGIVHDCKGPEGHTVIVTIALGKGAA